ncbi:MAG: RNA polymerase factor sigma-54, partial [Methylococcaceae bacterium]
MKQSLHVRLGQQLTMTPQLQQAIKLLQMSTLDLQQEIQQVLDSNIMLEISEEDSISRDPLDSSESNHDYSESFTSEGSQTDIPDELPIDSSWEDTYETVLAPGISNPETVEFESQRSNEATLLDHLLWQLELTIFSERDHAIAIAIIDSVNDEGYLGNTPEDIYQGLQNQFEDLDFDEIIAVL